MLQLFKRLEKTLFIVSLILLGFVIVFVSKANVRTDSIDYYVMLQRVVTPEEKPLIQNSFFVEQRSPGYPLLATIPYYFLHYAINPFVETELVNADQAPISVSSNLKSSTSLQDEPSELLSLPYNQHIPFGKVFFKDFYVRLTDSWFQWQIIAALLLTSFIFMFVGIIVMAKNKIKEVGQGNLYLIIGILTTSFMIPFSVVNMPAYATLTAFGLSSLFCYFFMKGWHSDNSNTNFIAGIFLGLLILTRLEVVVFAIGFFIALLCTSKRKNGISMLLGGLISLIILCTYNYLQYGNIIYLGILKGNINIITFNFHYIYDALINPSSGILIWSPLIFFGIVGLFIGKENYNKVLATGTIVLMLLLVLRIPAMYLCVGEGSLIIEGIKLSCPQTQAQATSLVRSDVNRYSTVFIPFALIGLQNFLLLYKRKQ